MSGKGSLIRSEKVSDAKLQEIHNEIVSGVRQVEEDFKKMEPTAEDRQIEYAADFPDPD